MYRCLRTVPVILLALVVSCAAPRAIQCPPGTQALPDCPPVGAINDEDINRLYASRTWVAPRDLDIDPVKLGKEAQVPINHALARLLGPTPDDGLNSLAAKLWMIENAQHTVDLMYYIFARDEVGYAVIGALCNAVKRGVDVRFMVDSLGSFNLGHSGLRALETCADDAGFMRNAKGQITTKKARVQVVIFNAITKFKFNRRSHDKLLVVDGHFPDEAAVMTGGRNISLDYYGIHADGSPDPTAFRDLEILLRVPPAAERDKYEVGGISEIYYTLLFLHKGNRRIRPIEFDEEDYPLPDRDELELKKARESLAFLTNQPEIKKRLDAMPRYMTEGFRSAKVRLAHQLGNLTAQKVTTHVAENIESNPNSITYLISKLTGEAARRGVDSATLRIVSPYLFSGRYYDDEGNLVYDGAKQLLDYLHQHPRIKIEVITNSVMTSDNFFTQAVIDMDMAPRLLLTPKLQKAWQSGLDEGEFNPKVVDSPEWKQLVNDPQVFIYQTGKIDSVILGGMAHYGKLHAKFILGDKIGFIGTSNFDYRSNLYNNEMGFFFISDALHDDLLDIFDLLKSTSYRWGSPEWLQMRKEVMESDSKKAGPARKQRIIFKTLRATGLEYLM